MSSYKRVLLKLSGEQLAGKYEFGVDPEIASFLAAEIKKVVESGCQVVMIVGGGNMVRGEELAGNGIRRVTADQMGMLSGLINSMAMTDIFEASGVKTRCLSNIFAQQVAESYSYRLAEKHLQKGRVVIVAGGTARPYVTHDTAAVSFALELDCELVLKASKVDGVYDKDPAQFPDAAKLEKVSFQEAVQDNSIKVMDKAA
ncbi:MAG TPA: uridine monophosphate kinase, partial [Methylomirabilota bacterium]|nr:uridine monophosphate kinase [Methylomirabilota bacterium]